MTENSEALTQSANNTDTSLTLITTADVMKKLACKRTKLNSLMRLDPTFPKPVRFSANCIRWNVADIDMWIKSKMG